MEEDLVSYLHELSARAAALEERSEAIGRGFKTTEQRREVMTKGLHGELGALSEEIEALGADMKRTADSIVALVAQFQRLGMQEHLRRVSDKADLWHPEERISRDEFKRVIKK